jgi:hypothetical protein
MRHAKWAPPLLLLPQEHNKNSSRSSRRRRRRTRKDWLIWEVQFFFLFLTIALTKSSSSTTNTYDLQQSITQQHQNQQQITTTSTNTHNPQQWITQKHRKQQHQTHIWSQQSITQQQQCTATKQSLKKLQQEKLQQEHGQILPHNNKSLKIAPTISKFHSKFTPTTKITSTISTNTYDNKHSLQNRNQHQTNTYITTSNRSKITTNINKYTP